MIKNTILVQVQVLYLNENAKYQWKSSFSVHKTTNYNHHFSQEIISDHCFHFIHGNLFVHCDYSRNRVQRYLYVLLYFFLLVSPNFFLSYLWTKIWKSIFMQHSIKFIENGVNIVKKLGFVETIKLSAVELKVK